LKLRVKFEKGDEVKLISHLNLIKVFVQALRRSGLPVAYSEGFSPHPRVSFGPPLTLGIKSKGEFADLVLEKAIDKDEFKIRFNKELPEGLKIMEVGEVPRESKSLMAIIDIATYKIKPDGEGRSLDISLHLKGKIKIKEAVKSLLGKEELNLASLDMERTGLFVEKEGKLVSPLEL